MRSLINKVLTIALSLLVCVTQFPLTTFAVEGNVSANENLALNKPVTYSGVEGGKKGDAWVYPQFVGEQAVDGKADTRWSADKTDDQWLIVDLEDEYSIGTITLNFHAESPEYEILVAGEDKEFKQIAGVTDGSANGATVVKSFEANGTNARYIKYHQTKMWKHATNGKYYSSSIIDIDVAKFKSTEVTDDTLRVGTFNIAANKKFDITAQSALTNDYNLEIVGLQEVDRNTKRNSYDMLESFKTSGNYNDSYYSKTIDFEGGEYGIGTVSAYPLSDQSSTSLEWDGSAEKRVYQRSVFTKSGHEVAFYNTHLSYETTELRLKQMAQLKEAIAKDPVEYKIIVGDFNADQSRAEFNLFLDELNMCNGYYGKWYDTFNGVDATMKVNSVDNILVTKNLQIDDVTMVPTKLSDHNLFVTTLTFLDEPAVSYEWLRCVLDEAKQIDGSPYTEASFNALKVAIAEASKIYIDEAATQKALDDAVKELQKAINALEYFNLAYKKAVTFSGVEGDKVNGSWKYPQFVGEKAVDGDSATRWSAAKLDSQYLTVDLGEVTSISEVLLYFYAETTDYEVQISTDGENFTSVFHQTNGTSGDTIMRQVSFPAQEARYVKFVQNVMWNHTNGNKYSASLSELEVYKEFNIASIALEEASNVISAGETLQLQTIITPALASHKDVVYTSSNPDVANVDNNGLITALKAGKTTIKVSSKADPTINVTKEIQVVDGEIKVQEFRFSPDEISLTARDKRFLEYNVYPENAINPDVAVNWSSSDESIATVDEHGYVDVLAQGDVVITVQSKEDAAVKGSLTIHATKANYSESYDMMKDRWLRRVVGEDLDMSDPDIAAYVTNIDTEGNDLWSKMHKGDDRTTLWDKLASDTTSADYTTQVTKLKKLALAFGVEGTSLYHNKDLLADIVDGVNFMVVNKKYNGTYSTGNWWDWQIGVTQPLVDLLMIISDYTDYSNIEPAIKAIEGYAKKPSIQWPSYTATGANRTDIGLSVLGSAIIAKNDDRMNLVKNEVPDVMKLVTSGDGLYADGSVVQHTKHAYTGSYGNELLKGVGRIQSIIADTEFDITDTRINNVYNTISKGYIPLMHKGQMLSMVNGRSISRAPGTNPFTTEFEAGSETISNIMLIAQFAPEQYRDEYLSAIKGWLEESADDFNFYGHARDFDALLSAKEIVNDENVDSLSYKGMHVYGSMDRVVQANDNYTVGLSMYSSRIYNYEFGNTENKKGWHTGDGVLYLYNNDLKQYGEGYWPTIDPYRLPGTTVDTKALADGAAYNKTSPQSWVGGVSDGNNGAAGMYYNASNLGTGMDVKAQKSWFFLDGKVVALGTNINGTSSASIETTIENRMLTGENNTVSINGTTWDETAKDATLTAGSYIHMTGTGEGNDIGYYFPQDESVEVSKETRTGKYSDINEYFVNDKEYENTFFKMGINHGQTVTNDSYEYVLLPGASEEETKAYANKNGLTILRNDVDVQAIKDEDSGIFAMNTWPESEISVNGIKVNNSASIFTQVNGGVMDIYVSDPKQKSVNLEVTLENGYKKVLYTDNDVTVDENGVFKMNSKGKAGASFHISVQIETEDTTLTKGLLKNSIDKANIIVASGQLDTLAPAVQTLIRTRLAEANSVYENVNSTNTECLTAWLNLANALHYLDFKADKAALKALIDDCEKIDLNEYAGGVEAFQEALATAKTVYADDGVLQNTIATAFTNLSNAKDALVKKDLVDKTLLIDLINGITTHIGDGSAYRKDAYWTAFQDAMNAANAVIADENATQAQLETAYITLTSTYEDIRLLPDESLLAKLDTFIQYVDQVDLSNYSEEHATYIMSVRNQAFALRSDLNGFEEERYNSVSKEIAIVLDIIENKQLDQTETTTPPTKPEETQKPGSTDSASSSVETKKPTTTSGTTATGDSTNVAALAIAMLGGCAVITMLKRRKEQ